MYQYADQITFGCVIKLWFCFGGFAIDSSLDDFAVEYSCFFDSNCSLLLHFFVYRRSLCQKWGNYCCNWYYHMRATTNYANDTTDPSSHL